MGKLNVSVDRRTLEPLFRARLAEVIDRSGLTKTAFAARIGVDRSALSQLLSGRDPRLPRAETLAAIAQSEGVSLDWLLGLSREDGLATEVAAEVAVEERARGEDDSRLLEWRREAQGAKIRYVPATLPDFARLPEITALEHRGASPVRVQSRLDTDRQTLALSRLPQSDMEVCTARQRIESLASGFGFYADAPKALREAQLRHLAQLADELYPRFRLYLYNGTTTFSAAYTVFGARRAAVYMGDMYLVLNGQAQIDALTRHFDNLIRVAEVDARNVGDFINRLVRAM